MAKQTKPQPKPVAPKKSDNAYGTMDRAWKEAKADVRRILPTTKTAQKKAATPVKKKS